jgi:hypothetical protein
VLVAAGLLMLLGIVGLPLGDISYRGKHVRGIRTAPDASPPEPGAYFDGMGDRPLATVTIAPTADRALLRWDGGHIYADVAAPFDADELDASSSAPNDFSAMFVSAAMNTSTCSREVSTRLSFGQRPWR